MGQTNPDLKYQKRNWSKQSARVFSTKRNSRGSVDLIVYVAKRKIKFECYRDNKEEILKLAPHTRIHIWFRLDSKEHNGKWYTNASLQHWEVPNGPTESSPHNRPSEHLGMESMWGSSEEGPTPDPWSEDKKDNTDNTF